jgi:hypothetical protein
MRTTSIACAAAALCTGIIISRSLAIPQGAAPASPAAAAQAPAGQAASPAPSPTEASNTAADFAGDGLLSRLVGTWSVKGVAIAPDGGKTEGFAGTCRFGPAMGGTFLGGDHLITRGDSALQIQDVMGFAAPGGFTRSEITSGDRALFMSTGRWQADSQTLSFTTVNPLVTPDGRPRSLLTLFRFESDDRVVWTTAFITDGQPSGTVELTLSRESQVPGVSNPDTAFGAPMMAGGMPMGGAGQGAAAPGGQPGNFIVQSPMGVAVTRPPQSIAETQQVLQAMIKQKQQMQAQVSTMQQQVQDMSRNFHQAMQP